MPVNLFPLRQSSTLAYQRLCALLLTLLLGGGLLSVAHAAPALQEPPTHTVQPGETLSEIAQQYDLPMQVLMDLNGLDDPDALVEGRILRLPAFLLEENPEGRHMVGPGESLLGIARAYDVPLALLMELNGITDPDTIVIGQVLRLPAATESPDVPPATVPAETPEVTESPEESPATPTRAVTAPPEGTPTPIPTRDPAKNPIATLNRSYAVQSGDTLARIALRLGVDEAALRLLNDLEPGAPLAAGQELLLPATGRELTVQAPRTPEQEVTVAPGDTLSQIAAANQVSLVDLMQANRISNPDAIVVGQTLVIPSPAAEEEEAATTQLDGRRRGFYYYTVRPGDTLSQLAKSFDTPILALLEFNNLPNESTVYAGLELRIPYGAPPLPVATPPTPLSGTRFMVSLSRQQCWLFQGSMVKHRWTCSTGYGEWITRTGDFAVQSKIELASSSAYRLDMPYWLGIYDVGNFENGIHGLPIEWDTGEKIWTTLIGEPATFGCAMLDDPDAALLFDYAYIGMPVHILP